MKIIETRADARSWVAENRLRGRRTGLVPTMGYLHRGHMSLVEIARARCDTTALTIFVNPLQFGPTEDFSRYPRDRERDLALAEEAGVDLVFIPPVEEMYPSGDPWIKVVPERGADVLDGQSRPGHFKGVLTVVAKLFGIFAPDVAVFGQKDLQQLFLIRRMVRDLDMGVEIITGRTFRDGDGLAMSSRNRYLSSDERRRALAIPRAILDCEALFATGERNASVYRDRLRRIDGDGVTLEYGEIVSPDSLEPVDEVNAGVFCAVAARVGSTRLIDNVELKSDGDR